MSKISRTLDEEDNSISDRVTGLMRNCMHTGINEGFKTSTIGLNSTIEEMRDIAAEASDIAENTEADDDQLNATQERLNLLYRLQKETRGRKQYRADQLYVMVLRQSCNNLKKWWNNCCPWKEIDALQKDMVAKATEIREARKSHSGFREKDQRFTSSSLPPNARLKVQMKRTARLCSHGKRWNTILFAPPKALFTSQRCGFRRWDGSIDTLSPDRWSLPKMEPPTMIFDEIDTGVSGEVASRMGTNHVSDGTITSIDQHYPFSSNCCQGSTPLLCI